MHNSFLLSAAALPLRSLFSFFPWLEKKEEEPVCRLCSAKRRFGANPRQTTASFIRVRSLAATVPIDQDPASGSLYSTWTRYSTRIRVIFATELRVVRSPVPKASSRNV